MPCFVTFGLHLRKALGLPGRFLSGQSLLLLVRFGLGLRLRLHRRQLCAQLFRFAPGCVALTAERLRFLVGRVQSLAALFPECACVLVSVIQLGAQLLRSPLHLIGALRRQCGPLLDSCLRVAGFGQVLRLACDQLGRLGGLLL